MKLLLAAFLVCSCAIVQAQMRSNLAQYMLNQGVINPGFADIETRYSATIAARKQWMTMGDTPFTGFSTGHYHFSRNHSIGGNISSDQVNEVNVTDISANYVFHLWLSRKVALGLGVKLGYQQISMKNNFVYFGADLDPALSRTRKAGFNMGTGLSIQSKNFLFGISMPYIFNNALANSIKQYSTTNNHVYSTIGYKCRFSDGFVFYPSVLVKAVSGAPLSISFDGHILVNQLFWFGGGYRSDNTVGISAGLFLDKGLRIVYTYESATFSSHGRLDSSHELSLNFARTIYESPFSKRLYRNRNGKMYKNPERRNKINHSLY